ncbi:MAG TPA: hypothetical protein VE360_18915, partial [Pyrinomonadaceae bacterium]|nr:hypothetical protein [Pyrinomonadaceae bacterium]
MRFSHPNTMCARLATLVLLAALSPALVPRTRVAAQPGGGAAGDTREADKLAPDVRSLVRGARRGEKVRVILQLDSLPSAGLNALLEGGEVRVRARYQNLDAWALEVDADEVGRLASFAEVGFVSGDYELRPLGHVTSTTGADDVRAPAGR